MIIMTFIFVCLQRPMNPTPCRGREISLTEDKVDVIKSAMKKISLPVDAVPPWAKEVDETVWKSKLIDKISERTSDTTS